MRFTLSVFLSTLMLSSLSLAAEKEIKKHMTARLEDASSAASALKLDIKLQRPDLMSNAQFRVVGTDKWQPLRTDKKGKFSITAPEGGWEEGQEIEIKARVEGPTLITDKLKLVLSDDGMIVETAEAKEVPIPLTVSERTAGGNDIHPQRLAQARADYMYANRLSGHAAGGAAGQMPGVVYTSRGRLCEGYGGNGPHGTTCSNKTWPEADASAGYVRLRLYHGQTFMPGAPGSAEGPALNNNGGGMRMRRR